ncbi:CMRF35-like molecule 8 [Pteropus vampyrus]|uniref:CMRF35-like molecule 8 n=1 Tax=Pteropus vampyrus TaxID=132908 RepID=A0A6P3QMT1_PTEVA|nr:CMRF35-like molecule 8 [Pteropus vampyrus]
MSQQDGASWLPSALLLLWVPGSLSLSGPSTVEGTVGGSLTVRCRYEKKFTENIKYWSKEKYLFFWETVLTTESERNGHVSIRDHPANLTFTVTLENLAKDDEGTYQCGINVPLAQDPTSKVVVSVFPDELHVLLSLLAILLLLLGGTSLLAWSRRWTRVNVLLKIPDCELTGRRVDYAGPQQTEPCYANMELQTQRLWAEPEWPRQAETEYSTAGAPREELRYSSIVVNNQSQDSKDTIPHQRPPPQEPAYSVIRKT